MADEPIVETKTVLGTETVTPPVIVEDAAAKAAADEAAKAAALKADPKVLTEAEKAAEAAKQKETEFKPYEVTAPEGAKLDPESVKAFSAVANELKLPQEAAQKLAAWYDKHSTEKATANTSAWKAVNDGWVDAGKKDAEIGGEKWDTSVEHCRAAIKSFGTKEFTDMLNLTGAGNHPEMIRFLTRVHNATKEDKMISGGQGAQGGKDIAKIMFPNQN